MKIMFIGDLHIGKKPSHSTKDSAFRYRGEVDETFTALASHKDADVVVQLGDVFDRYSVTDSDFVRALGLVNQTDYVLRGNHDYAHDTTNSSALENLKGVAQPMVITTPWVSPVHPGVDLHFVPYMPTQKEFLEALANLHPAEDKVNILCLHTNMHAEGFSCAEVENNLSKSLAASLAKDFDLIVSGHEHNWSVKSGVHMVGSVLPCSFGDMKDKFGLLYDTEAKEVSWLRTWDAATEYIKVSAEQFLKLDSEIVQQFVEIVGLVKPEQVLPVAKHMRFLFQESHVVSIKNSLKVEKQETLSSEGIEESVSWVAYVSEQLNPEQVTIFQEMCDDC